MTVVIDGYLTHITEAKNALSPLIRGLRDMMAFQHISEENKGFLRKLETDLLRRRERLSTVISVIQLLDDAVAGLDADGYPDIPRVVLSTTLFDELQKGVSDVEAADRLFENPPIMTITLGEKSDKE